MQASLAVRHLTIVMYCRREKISGVRPYCQSVWVILEPGQCIPLNRNTLHKEDHLWERAARSLRKRLIPQVRFANLLGTNGAGKTTLLRAALGLIVLLVGMQMGLELFVRPNDIFMIAPGIAD